MLVTTIVALLAIAQTDLIKRVPPPPVSTSPLRAQPEGEALIAARDLKIMYGWPVEPTFRVTADRLLVAPYSRWGLQHADQVLPTTLISRGTGAPWTLPTGEPIDVDAITFTDKDGAAMRVGDFFAKTGLDGLMVLHHGKIVCERYANGMTRDQQHLILGATQGLTGIFAMIAIGDGKVPPGMKGIDLLKDFEYSAWRGASAQEIVDMTMALRLPPNSESEYLAACGLVPDRTAGLIRYLHDLNERLVQSPHGEQFEYMAEKAEVLAEIVRRKERSTLAQAIETRIWSKLGAERDARMVLDPLGVDVTGLGLMATVPDLARFAQMLVQRGSVNGHEVIPSVVALDLLAGGDSAMLAKNVEATRFLPGGAFHAGWWNMPREDGASFALGDFGQTIWINPKTEVVIVRVSSHSQARSDFLRINEIRALSAIAKAVAEKN